MKITIYDTNGNSVEFSRAGIEYKQYTKAFDEAFEKQLTIDNEGMDEPQFVHVFNLDKTQSIRIDE